MRSHGFTLIELMIVVAIIGILAAVALPAYQDYVSTAQLTEGPNLKRPYRAMVEEFYAHRGYFPRDNQELGVPAPGQITGQYVKAVRIENGRIITEYTDAVADSVPEGRIVDIPCVVPDAPGSPVVWNCQNFRRTPQPFVPVTALEDSGAGEAADE